MPSLEGKIRGGSLLTMSTDEANALRADAFDALATECERSGWELLVENSIGGIDESPGYASGSNAKAAVFWGLRTGAEGRLLVVSVSTTPDGWWGLAQRRILVTFEPDSLRKHYSRAFVLLYHEAAERGFAFSIEEARRVAKIGTGGSGKPTYQITARIAPPWSEFRSVAALADYLVSDIPLPQRLVQVAPPNQGFCPHPGCRLHLVPDREDDSYMCTLHGLQGVLHGLLSGESGVAPSAF